MTTLTPELSERKRILKNVCKKQPTWKLRIGFAALLFAASAFILIANCYLLITHPTDAEGVFIFTLGAIAFSCIPYICALSVKNTAKYRCGFPYSSYANGTLLLHSDGLEYIFWRVGPHEPAAYSSKRAVYREKDRFVYRIEKKDILSLSAENDICRIKGNGKMEIPEWAVLDKELKQLSKEFSFILSFAQENPSEIIQKWGCEI